MAAIKVAIFGSCISRDVVELGVMAGSMEIVGCFCRSSFASMAGMPDVDEDLLSRVSSSFQQRMIRADMDKSFLSFLQRADFDILLMDLVEERFPLLVTGQGSLHTLSDEYLEHVDRLVKGKLIVNGSHQYYEQWHRGWYAVKSILEARGMMANIRLLEVFWATRIADGSVFTDPDIQRSITAQNHLLPDHYAYLHKVLADGSVITYPEEYMVAAARHQWDVAPTHYIPAMYSYTLEQVLASVSKAASPAISYV